ncbi:hypothetical protein ACWJJH_13450 [Endozoicomonadaceae bacterium StTr2]
MSDILKALTTPIKVTCVVLLIGYMGRGLFLSARTEVAEQASETYESEVDSGVEYSCRVAPDAMYGITKQKCDQQSDKKS